MPNYQKAKDIFIQRKTTQGTFEEYPLIVEPNSILFTTLTNDLVAMATESLFTNATVKSASFSDTASYALNVPLTASFADTASFANTASFALNVPATASYAILAAMSSMSLSTLGLVVKNAPISSTDVIPAVLQDSATINDIQPHATIKIGNKLYGGGWGGGLFVLNDPDNDLSNMTTASCITGYADIAAVCYSSVTGYLYFITGGDPSDLSITGSIVRVDPNDIVNGQTIFYQGLAGYDALPCICTDGNYLYVGTGNYPSSFLKINIVTGELVASVPWVSESTAIGYAHAAVMAPDNQYFYVTSAGYSIAKVRTSDLSYITNRIEGASFSDDIVYLNGYIYSGAEFNFYVWKISADDLSYTSSYAYMNTYGAFTDGVHVYITDKVFKNIWVYYYGDLEQGPVIFSVTGTPNEMWITDGGKFVITDWYTSNIRSYILPITQVGINKSPLYTLDVAGVIHGQSAILDSQLIVGNIMGNNVIFSGSFRNTASNISLSQTGVIRSIHLTASNGVRAPYITASIIKSNVISASILYGTASHAISASYALNGGGSSTTASYSNTSSIIVFNGNRSIKRSGYTGINVGGTDLATFIENFFFPFIPSTVAINSGTTYYQTGSNQNITITATITENDETSFGSGSIKKNGNSIYTTGTPCPVSFGTTDSGVSSNCTYYGYVQVDNNGSPSIIASSVKTATFVFPYLWGMSTTAGLSGVDLYNEFTKQVVASGNKTVSMIGNTTYIYFAYPASYPALTSILDPNSFEVISNFEYSSSVNVISNGLDTNWSNIYRVYRTRLVSDPNGNYQFKQ